ncbi:MAG TPA: lanthionine synthetase LanC family protein [Mycobacteriales bacterium]|nr:lanthionine synthetase LanC family protein [Mycobacteriales bacterium]
MTQAPAQPLAAVLGVAREVMRGPVPTTGPLDAGPGVLAGLVASLGDDVAGTERLVAGWLHRYQREVRHSGLIDGGLAGMAAGASAAVPAWPRMAGLAAHARKRLVSNSPTAQPPERIQWNHYDVLHGAAGLALALVVSPDCRPDQVLPAATWLAGLCDTDDLSRARVTGHPGDPLRDWNTGRVNLGVGHGVAGIAAALLASLVVTGPRQDLARALDRIVRFLQRESYVDDRGIRTWPPAGRRDDPPPTGASGRQAWCYGTPGVAWVLWEAGRVLAAPDVQRFAADAMESLCRCWDDELHVDPGPAQDSLAFCHGLAGVLLVAGAFDRHAGLPGASGLRAHVRGLLLARLDEVRGLAGHDLSHLTGASGVLSALLTDIGGERSWLPTFALR